MINTVFLDRDGVINIDSEHYIKTPSEFEFIPESQKAIALLSKAGLSVIVITNQSAIARKMASMETLTAIFDKMRAGVRDEGGNIDDIFFCPHHPDDQCECRKPRPKMILDAALKHDLTLSRAVMVGDSAKDIECGIHAGCARTILVKTGNGHKALKDLAQKGLTPDVVCDDLYQAALWIMENK